MGNSGVNMNEKAVIARRAIGRKWTKKDIRAFSDTLADGIKISREMKTEAARLGIKFVEEETMEKEKNLFGDHDDVINALELEITEITKEIEKKQEQITAAEEKIELLDSRINIVRTGLKAARRMADKDKAKKTRREEKKP